MVWEFERLDARFDWRVNGSDSGRIRGYVDVVGKPKDGHSGLPMIFVEAELRKDGPASNVLKLWRWAEGRTGPKPGFVLFQAFSAVYRSAKREHRLTAEFVGRKMAAALGPSVTYVALNFVYSPRKGAKRGAGRRSSQAKRLARRIARRMAFHEAA